MINRKTIAWGMPDDPVPRWLLVCVMAIFLHARLRVLLGIAAFPALSDFLRASSYLAKPGRLAPRGVIPCFGAGSATDVAKP